MGASLFWRFWNWKKIEKLTDMGLKEGIDFTLGDPKSGQISIKMESLPSAPSNHTVQSLGYSNALESAIGIKVSPDFIYSSAKDGKVSVSDILVVELVVRQQQMKLVDY